MQYLLTKDELNELVDKSELTKRDEALEAARILILELADDRNDNCNGCCDNCPINLLTGMSGGDLISDLICKEPKSYIR